MVDTWQAYRETDFYTCLLGNSRFEMTGCPADEPLLRLNSSGGDFVLSQWLASCIHDIDRISMKPDFYTTFPALEPTVFGALNIPEYRRCSSDSEYEHVISTSTHHSSDVSHAIFDDLPMTPPDLFIEGRPKFRVVPKLRELPCGDFDTDGFGLKIGFEYQTRNWKWDLSRFI